VSEIAARRSSWWRLFRLALAFLLPAVVAGFVGSLILSFTVLSDMISSPDEPLEEYGFTRSGLVSFGTAMGATWGQIATAFIGIPAHVWLMQRAKPKARHYASTGAFAGAVFGGLIAWPMVFGLTLPPLDELAWLAIASIAAGAIAGLTFWLIRRPDRDRKSRPEDYNP